MTYDQRDEKRWGTKTDCNKKQKIITLIAKQVLTLLSNKTNFYSIAVEILT